MRAAQQQAQQNVNTANQMQGTYEGEGQAIQSALTPKLLAETTASHSMNPNQLNELLTYAGAGAGGATGAFNEQGALNAARTRNTGGLTSSLDAASRGRQQALAKASEGIAAEDVGGALANKQTALGELGEMGRADTSAAMGALGLSNEAIGQEVNAGKSGWFQNMTDMIRAIGSLTGGGGGGGGSSGGGPSSPGSYS